MTDAPLRGEGERMEPLMCKRCGHAKSMHDTGWDASGCMQAGCSCQSTHSTEFEHASRPEAK